MVRRVYSSTAASPRVSRWSPSEEMPSSRPSSSARAR